MSKINRAVTVLAGCVLSALSLVPGTQAQSRYAEIAFRNSRAQVYHEAIVVPSASEDVAAVHFRIPNSLLVFVQQGGGFAADVEVSVEIHENGRKREDRIWRSTHLVATFEETQARTSDLQGTVLFDLPTGEYSYKLLPGQGVAGDLRPPPPQTFRVPDRNTERLGRGFFVEIVDTTGPSVELIPVGLGGDVPFGRKVQAVVPIAAAVDGAELAYRLHRVAPENEEVLRRKAPLERYETGRADFLVGEGGAAGIVSVGAAASDDCLCWDRSASSESRLALLDLRTGSLEDGLYMLDVHLKGGGRSEQTQLVFRTHWRTMPISLYDVEVAIRNLEFIESREVVRAMLRGSRRDRIEKFKSYWKERDPTPGTIENELMEEYYRRVDHSALEFRTGATPYPDGLRTDAGRVYIVHGPPDKISHSFPSSGGVQQEWTYADGRKFVFRSDSSLDPLVLEERKPR